MVGTERAVLFDLHDTLVHLVPSTEEALAAALGVPVADYRVAWHAIDERIEQGSWTPTTDDRWTDLYRPLVNDLGLLFSPEEVAARFSDLFRSTDSYVAFSDVAHALRGLVETGFRLGVLSNSDFPLEPILEGCGIGGFIFSAVPAVSHGTTKPYPEAFLLGTDALGVRPQGCWFVGDRLIDDVTASAALGMKPVLVDRTGRYASASLPFPRIPDLSLLQAIIEQLPERRAVQEQEALLSGEVAHRSPRTSMPDASSRS
ncbi:MAG: HAD family hydrolase [Actinomycetota bacterium]|nr:HAD family hydrolase [Actinomycetota bacterium]